MRESARANGYANGTKYGSLESQVMYDPKYATLLPTPQAMDGTEIRGKMGKNDVLVQTESGLRRKVQTGSDFGVSLGFMANNALLPTPRTCSAMGASLDTEGNLEGNRCANLETVVGRMLLPTPRANKVTDMDLNNPALAERNKANLGEEVAKMVINDMLPTPTCNDAPNATLPKSQEKRNDSLVKRILTGEMGISIPKEDGQTFRLSPLFTEEMMGFPFLWTTLPFLRHNGAPNPSKPTETP